MKWAHIYRNLKELKQEVKEVIMSGAGNLSLEEYAEFTDCWEEIFEINQLLAKWDSDECEDLKRRLINEAFEEDDNV